MCSTSATIFSYRCFYAECIKIRWWERNCMMIGWDELNDKVLRMYIKMIHVFNIHYFLLNELFWISDQWLYEVIQSLWKSRIPKITISFFLSNSINAQISRVIFIYISVYHDKHVFMTVNVSKIEMVCCWQKQMYYKQCVCTENRKPIFSLLVLKTKNIDNG